MAWSILAHLRAHRLGHTLYGVGSLLNLMSRWMRKTWEQVVILAHRSQVRVPVSYQVLSWQFWDGAVLVDDLFCESFDERFPIPFRSSIIRVVC